MFQNDWSIRSVVGNIHSENHEIGRLNCKITYAPLKAYRPFRKLCRIDRRIIDRRAHREVSHTKIICLYSLCTLNPVPVVDPPRRSRSIYRPKYKHFQRSLWYTTSPPGGQYTIAYCPGWAPRYSAGHRTVFWRRDRSELAKLLWILIRIFLFNSMS